MWWWKLTPKCMYVRTYVRAYVHTYLPAYTTTLTQHSIDSTLLTDDLSLASRGASASMRRDMIPVQPVSAAMSKGVHSLLFLYVG